VLACPAEKTDADFAFLQQQQQSFGILKSLHPQKQFFFSGNKMYIRKKAPHPHAQQIFMATVVLKTITITKYKMKKYANERQSVSV